MSRRRERIARAALLALLLLALAALASGARAQQEHVVDMRDFAFEPPTLRVAPREVVRFVNHDNQPHTATSETAGAFDTGNIAAGETGSFVAPAQPGEYRYFCVHHAGLGDDGHYEGMVATLVVEAPTGADDGPPTTTEDSPQPSETPGASGVLAALALAAVARISRRRAQ